MMTDLLLLQACAYVHQREYNPYIPSAYTALIDLMTACTGVLLQALH